MFGRNPISDWFFDLPEGLSKQEKTELLERARYETFTQTNVVCRVTLFDWIAVIFIFLCASGLSWLLLEFTPLGESGLLARSLTPALIIAMAIAASQLAVQHNRARVMNPKIREIARERKRSDKEGN